MCVFLLSVLIVLKLGIFFALCSSVYVYVYCHAMFASFFLLCTSCRILIIIIINRVLFCHNYPVSRLCCRNTKCGLLHCSGGTDKPVIGYNQTFSKTVVHDVGRQYECK